MFGAEPWSPGFRGTSAPTPAFQSAQRMPPCCNELCDRFLVERPQRRTWSPLLSGGPDSHACGCVGQSISGPLIGMTSPMDTAIFIARAVPACRPSLAQKCRILVANFHTVVPRRGFRVVLYGCM